MATIAEMISRLRSSFKLINADDILSNRFCYSEIKSAGQKLIKRQTDKRLLFSSDSIFTELPCLEMEEVSLSSCCNYTSPCQISRSKLVLPKIAVNIYGPLVNGFYSIDGTVRFNYTDPDRYANLLKLNPEHAYKKYYWIKNGRIWCNDSLLEEGTLSACFDDDFTIEDFSCSGPPDCPSNPMDGDFKCPSYLYDDVLRMARETILKDYKQSKDDKTVDNNDESK